MMVIGIVGKIGTGKTVVAKIMENLGAKFILLDEIGHRLLEENKTVKREVIKSFGRQILALDNRIDRAKLAEIVFANPRNIHRLNRIMHPRMFREVKRKVSEIKSKTPRRVVVIEGAVLFESKICSLTDKIIMITSPRNLIIKRLLKQGRFPKPDVLRRLNSQKELDREKRLVNHTIKNTGSLNYLRKSVEAFWKEKSCHGNHGNSRNYKRNL